MPTAPRSKGGLASSLTNLRVSVGRCTDDGASGNDLDVSITWGCTSAEFEPSNCKPRSKSAEGRFWHQAAQAANKIAGISVVRLMVTWSCKRQATPRLLGSSLIRL